MCQLLNRGQDMWKNNESIFERVKLGNEEGFDCNDMVHFFTFFYEQLNNAHSSEIRGSYLMKWPGEMLQNLVYFI